MPAIELPTGTVWYARQRAADSPYPPLLLIHGAGGSHLDWPAELRRLPHATVLTPDLPGHGRSPGRGRRAVATYAGDMIALLDTLGIARAIVGGHSMGGAVAQTLALEAPARVAGLILIGTGARLRVHPDILNGLSVNPDPVYDLLVAWHWAENTPQHLLDRSRQQLAATDLEVLHGDYVACDAFDVMAEVGRITAPTLVIGGTADRMTPLKYSAYLADQIPGAELVSVPGGGHMMALEQPQVVAGAVRAWLEKQDWDAGWPSGTR